MILNLSSNFKPIDGDEIKFENFTFSGGEPHIKINPNFDISNPITITHRLNSFNDLGLLVIAVDALTRMGAIVDKLYIPYFPASRQDRVMIKGEPLTVKIYADIINSLLFKKVIIFDAHSEVTPALINNCDVVSNHKFIEKIIQASDKNIFLSNSVHLKFRNQSNFLVSQLEAIPLIGKPKQPLQDNVLIVPGRIKKYKNKNVKT